MLRWFGHSFITSTENFKKPIFPRATKPKYKPSKTLYYNEYATHQLYPKVDDDNEKKNNKSFQ